MAGLGDLIGGAGGFGIDLGPTMQAFYVVGPIIIWAIVGIGGLIAFLWLKKFRYIVYIHSQRSDGKILIKRTRGGFFTNHKTKVERVRIFSDLKAIIPPPQNRFIKREDGKDIIHFLRTTGKEYIPMNIISEDKYLEEDNNAKYCAKCKKNYLIDEKDIKKVKKCPECGCEDFKLASVLIEKRDFQVLSEQAKDWFEIATNEDERKYAIGGWLMQNQTIVIALTWGAVFLMSVMFIMGQVENAVDMGKSVISNCRELTVSLGLLIPNIFRRKK